MTSRPSFRAWVKQDLAVNRGAPESQLIVTLFRAAQWLQLWGRPHLLVSQLLRLYVAVTYLGLHVELPPRATVGPGLRIHHPHVIVLNPGVVLGRDCVLRHLVTVGNVSDEPGKSGCPVLGDGVELGVGATVLGPITVGDGARIGAGAVVTKDVPAGGVVVGATAILLTADEPQSSDS